MRERLDPGARAWTLGATMFTVFGLLALLLAAIGLYGVLAFDVAQRTRELGIRGALGAGQGRLLRSVLCEGARFSVLGIVLGLSVVYVAAPYAQELLFEVSARDPGVACRSGGCAHRRERGSESRARPSGHARGSSDGVEIGVVSRGGAPPGRTNWCGEQARSGTRGPNFTRTKWSALYLSSGDRY